MVTVRSLAPCLVPLLGLLAAACTDGDGTAPTEVTMPSVGLDAPPGFEVGDSFQFDNPAVSWTVVAVEDGRAQWESDGGDAQVTEMNPLLPALQWKSDGQGSGKRLISAVEGSLFPLEVGAKTSFRSTVNMDRPPYAWEADWTCEIVGVKQVEVPAGNFNTFEVVCTRAGVDENRFLYAPDLGHWVVSMSQESADGPVRSRRLVSFTKARASTLVIGTDPTGETVVESERAPAMQSDETAPAAMAEGAKKPAMAEPMPKPKPIRPPKQTAAKPPAPAMKPAGSGYGLHIASYKDPSNADPGWRILKKRYDAVLAPHEPMVRRVDLGSKGVFYRLLAGPIADRAAAAAQCRRLAESGQYCKVIAL